MSEDTKLISKEFLKQGKVSEMMSVNPHCEATLLNRVTELEACWAILKKVIPHNKR